MHLKLVLIKEHSPGRRRPPPFLIPLEDERKFILKQKRISVKISWLVRRTLFRDEVAKKGLLKSYLSFQGQLSSSVEGEIKTFLGFINSSHGLWSNWDIRAAAGREAHQQIPTSVFFQEENQLENSTEWNLKEFPNLLERRSRKSFFCKARRFRDITRKISAKFFF